MNDHQDSENYSYERSWSEIHEMLDKAERKQNIHYMKMKQGKKSERVYHMRNYKGLEGVINGLRWVLGDMKMSAKKVLGDE
jgi:hypothetical protein